MIGDFIYDHFGWIYLILVVIVFAAVFAAMRHDHKEANKACAQMWSLARNAHDSMEVVQACNLPKQSQYIPVVIPIYTGH